MTFEEFESAIQTARDRGAERVMVPVHRRRSADLLTPVSAFLSLKSGADYSFLFESVEGGEKLARYSFLGRDPYRIVRATDDGASVTVENRRTPESPPATATNGTADETAEAEASAAEADGEGPGGGELRPEPAGGTA